MRRIVEEREAIKRSELARREEARAAAEEEVRQRWEVGNLVKEKRGKERIAREGEQREERVVQQRQLEKEVAEKEHLRRSQCETSQQLGMMLRSQMRMEEEEKKKREEERKVVEAVERRRLEELVWADKVGAEGVYV